MTPNSHRAGVSPAIFRFSPGTDYVQRRGARILIAAIAILLCAAADGSWLKHVPDADRRRANPYAGQSEAAAAGARLFSDHCAQCHGSDALGRGNHPSLRSDRVQHATDGEIFWLLKNGNLSRGMPTWSALPEQSRWQIITYVKSLGPSSSQDQSQEKSTQ
jgi:mono/diheme cytochrome c family protein